MHGARSPLDASLQPCAICMTLMAAPRGALLSGSRIAPTPPLARKFELLSPGLATKRYAFEWPGCH